MADGSGRTRSLVGLHWAEGMLSFVGGSLFPRDAVREDSWHVMLWPGSGNRYMCLWVRLPWLPTGQRRWSHLGCSARPRQLQEEQGSDQEHPPVLGISEASVSLATRRKSVLSPQMTQSNQVNLKNVQGPILSHLAAPSAHILLSVSCRHTGIEREK